MEPSLWLFIEEFGVKFWQFLNPKKLFNKSIQRRRLTAKQRKKLLAKQKEAFVTQASKSSSALGAGWSSWTPFASCSGVCGAGSTLRRRFCKNAAVGSSYCPGAAVERKECTVSHLNSSLDSTYSLAERLRRSASVRLGIVRIQLLLAILRRWNHPCDPSVLPKRNTWCRRSKLLRGRTCSAKNEMQHSHMCG